MSKLGKALNVAKTIHEVATSKDPAAKVGGIVGAAVAASGHPWAAPVAAAGAKKAVEFVQRPEVQAKAKEVGQRAAAGAASAAGAAARGVHRGATNGIKKLQEFRAGHGK